MSICKGGKTMVKLNYADGKNEISNESGVQVIGSKAPDSKGLSPKELLEGAVALCISITLEKILERDKIIVNLNELEIEVKATKSEGITNRFTDFEAQVILPKDIDEDYNKLVKLIERGCTISNTLIKEAKVELIVK